MKNVNEHRSVHVLCPKLVLSKNEPSLQWLIGSPFFPPLTIVSSLRCIHIDSLVPDFLKESEDLRTLLPKGFDVIGALIVANSDIDENAGKAINCACRLRKLLFDSGELYKQEVLGAVMDLNTGEVHFFSSVSTNSASIDIVDAVVYEDHPQKYVWERGCLLRCELPLKLPIYIPGKSLSDAEKMFRRTTEAVVGKFKDPKIVYLIDSSKQSSSDIHQPVVLHGSKLEFSANLSDINLLENGSKLEFSTNLSDINLLENGAQDSDVKLVTCAHFCQNDKNGASVYSAENADKIQISVLFNSSEKSSKSTAPVAEYFPAMEETKLVVLGFKLEVLSYAAKDLPLSLAVSKLIIPGLVDQFSSMMNVIFPKLLDEHPQLHPYHFSPPGILHPVTIIYELENGETEMKLVDTRKSLHLRMGLPFDRPLLRIANAMEFYPGDGGRSESIRKASTLLKDVHMGIPGSGVSGGSLSLVQGSYEYYHYLHDGFNDLGWGCAYRSLQTIISWFRLQHYTSIEVPSHREIQLALVEIDDKDPSFIGSREWIGAIELSFVLDKLLGVSCKIINVRSGAELPEKCRELALHFENQGTPIMIGGGVLAYTLLGVDYNEVSGDCAFLILDPHYTGSDETKKIVNGGWCGWKKAVDSKGKNFFLHDKFYNLLLPQRPNMV